MTVWENVMMRDLSARPFSIGGVLRRPLARERARELMREYDVRAATDSTKLGQLSGGNQQKVVIARELSRSPRLVIAFQPTHGLDVRASEFVYDQLNARKREGGGVLLISMDLDEVLALSDRIVVLSGGRVHGIVDAAAASAASVGALMVAGKAGSA
jgi:simple sugar transport system ATP-binding protein